MHVVMLSKACIVGAYQSKLEALAQEPDIRLTVLVPPSWRDDRGEQMLERVFTQGYTLQEIKLALNGRFHFHFYPRLGAVLDALQPDLLHIDEEPYNLATRHAMGLAARRKIPALFFTWQNLNRRYPPPFRWWERYNYAHARYAIAGNHDAAQVLQTKGYDGPIRVIPQFGVDPELFAAPRQRLRHAFTIGYAGGLIPAKGLDTLIRACTPLAQPWELHLVGTGSAQASLQALAESLGVATQVHWLGKRPSTAMPEFYASLDALVLPSRTQPNWMEQFGRVLIEAMACQTPVIGSNSGEIPHVIGDAGLIFPEGDVDALTRHLRSLQANAGLRAELGARGRQRVLAHFTQAQVARATAQVYRAMLGK